MSALSSAHSAATHSDSGLVVAARRGDDRAFGELYARYGRRIVSYVFGMVGDHGRAEDIAQEVFICALRRMRDTERPIAFKPWIYEIARNACIDEFRRSRRVREVPLAADDSPEGADRRLVSRVGAPDVSFERRQQIDDLRGAFRGLSDSHHKLIVLRELEGLSYEEIGRRMGMTRPVVESALFRARRRLNEEYEEIASGRRCEQVHAAIEAGARVVQSLGIKERRRLARHVSHCQPCRRFARAEGLDDSILRPPSLAGKLAALLPIPAFLRWRRGGGDPDGAVASTAGSHSFSALPTVQSVAQYVDPGSPAVGIGRVGAAIAAVVIAGGGVAGGLSATSGSRGGRPAVRVVPAALVPVSPGPSGAGRVAGTSAASPAATASSSGGSNTASVGTSSAATSNLTSAATSNPSGASGGTVAGAAASGQSLTGAGSTRAGSTGADSTGAAGATHTGEGSLGGGGTSPPTLPKLPVPTAPSIPLPPVTLPPLSPPTLDVAGTVQNTVDAIGNTAGSALDTVKGLL